MKTRPSDKSITFDEEGLWCLTFLFFDGASLFLFLWRSSEPESSLLEVALSESVSGDWWRR